MSKTYTLSKSKIISLLQCPKRLWLERHRPDLAAEMDEGTQLRFAAGERVDEVARGLFPEGIMVEGEDLWEKIQRTADLLAGPPRPLFQAAFRHKNVLTVPDILLPEAGGFKLIEVKSAASVKDYYHTDVAVQVWVLQGAGLDLRGIELAFIDSRFVYPGQGDYRGLFCHEDMSRIVQDLLPDVPRWVQEGQDVLASDTEPQQTPGDQCGTPFDCPFHGYCAPETTEYPVELLPRIGRQAQALRDQGLNDIRDIPDSVPLTFAQRRVREVTKTGRAMLSAEAGAIINNLPWPRWYMDFETLALAVPEWAGTRPYHQVPFQWSCHNEAADGTVRHYEFLAEGEADPRRDFAESLIAGLSDSGPVLVYNATFENRILKETAATFPDLAGKLDAISERVFDLLPLAREHYYHPEMRGSWSLKSVLPTVAPDLTYETLGVSGGLEAQAAFQKMMALPKGSTEREDLRRQILEYCQLDTWALVVLARFFAGK